MKLMVIDGNSIINRAYYGIRPLSTRDGLYTHAIYGFHLPSSGCWTSEQLEALCVTFDRRSLPSAIGRMNVTRPSARDAGGAGHAAAVSEAGALRP